MMGGPSDRTMKTQRAYNTYRMSSKFSGGCVYCASGEIEVEKRFDHFLLVPSKFKYEIWDDHPVTQHYLIIPRRHVMSIREFSDLEKQEYVSLLSRYETEGYSFYSRAPSDPARSVTHFHTHLLMIGPELVDAMLYLHKPHVVLYRKRKK